MKRPVSTLLWALAAGSVTLLSVGSLVYLYLKEPPRRAEFQAWPDTSPGTPGGASETRISETEAVIRHAEQAILMAENERRGVPEPPGAAELFRTAERAVRAVAPGRQLVFARYGLPGTGVELTGENQAVVTGFAVPETTGTRLKYRVPILFLPGGYQEALWPEIEE